MRQMDSPATPRAHEEAPDETTLLVEAWKALATRPDEALAITDKHAARYPQSKLSQERERIAIEALVRLGRAAEAKPRAARLLEAAPRSAYRRKIERLVDLEQEPERRVPSERHDTRPKD
jgi:hypothetical protein